MAGPCVILKIGHLSRRHTGNADPLVRIENTLSLTERIRLIEFDHIRISRTGNSAGPSQIFIKGDQSRRETGNDGTLTGGQLCELRGIGGFWVQNRNSRIRVTGNR